jgi:purine-nucleoside phosphorylase
MDGNAGLRREAVAAAARIVAAGGRPAPLGIVLGTGLGDLACRFDAAVCLPASVSGWLASSTATGHAGRIVCGRVGACPVIALQGRVHAYEGFDDATITRGIDVLVALGVRTLLVTNASGGLRSGMTGGELLVLDDHLDLVRRPGSAAMTAPGNDRSALYSSRLVALALAAARRMGAKARAGVYARLLGPTYETRAEYRMLLRLGADAAGMSTIPEVVAARRLGVEVLAISVITNVANPDAPEETDADDVCRLAAGGADAIWGVIEALAADVAGEHGPDDGLENDDASS